MECSGIRYNIRITTVFLTANRILAPPGRYPGINGSTGIPVWSMDWTCGHRVRTFIAWHRRLVFINHTRSLISAQNIGSLSDCNISYVYRVCVVMLCYLHFKLQSVGNMERILWIINTAEKVTINLWYVCLAFNFRTVIQQKCQKNRLEIIINRNVNYEK